ncbi:MAG: HPr family phosphocarrier protein [Firmicutes bacterium]|nr:HPr family phosphocarrier protein [Bacillota bacterium]
MISKNVKVANKEGFHMRPATVFSASMAKYDCNVTIETSNVCINAKSVMNLIAACLKFGTELRIICDGTDEEEALQEAVMLVESGFGEV